jgi:hypothetical protein
VQVEDWESGEQVTLALDPELSAVEQAEALFKKVCVCGGALLGCWAAGLLGQDLCCMA